MSKKKRRKIRAEFKKKYDTRARAGDLTRRYAAEDPDEPNDLEQSERVSGKGSLTRKRTVIGTDDATDDPGSSIQLEVNEDICRQGRVLSVHGLSSVVMDPLAGIVRCTIRGLLKSLSSDQRNVLTTGDLVWYRPTGNAEGLIERVEPRHGLLSRTSRGRQHVLVSNVDQVLIVSSAAEPNLKPHLIDRMLVTAEQAGITPVICINKIDLIDPVDLQPLVGVFGQMGYQVLLLSAATGRGLTHLRRVVNDQQSVVAGQSGVGKSSLLNAIDPGLELRVAQVSAESQKGKHTTTAAHLLPLERGGFIVDTPGIRQFQLWDVIPEELAGLFRDLRPFVNLCRYPNCTHTHEAGCAVKDAVADGKLDIRRYESYCLMFANEAA